MQQRDTKKYKNKEKEKKMNVVQNGKATGTELSTPSFQTRMHLFYSYSKRITSKRLE